MKNPFSLSEEKLLELLKGYKAWLQSDLKEMEYPEYFRKQSELIKNDFLDIDVLNSLNDDELYERLYTYSRKLEGRAYRTISADVLRSSITALRNNLVFIMTSKESPFIIAEEIMEGERRISHFAKAFWSPILQAQFLNILPNWNNKTEDCLKVLGLDLSIKRLSTSEKYKKISEAFLFLSSLNPNLDFFSVNHLMHYVISIKEGIEMTARLQNNISVDPIIQMINSYKKHIRDNRLDDELYKWKLLKKYKGRPNLEASDFSAELKSIDFENLVFYNAIKVRDHIASKEPETFRISFRKLFDENIDLTTRVKTFMDEVMTIYRRHEKEYGHHHDERTIGVYLTFYNPDKYTIFKDSSYKALCTTLGTAPKKKGEKYAHYISLVGMLVDDYIKKDRELLTLVDSLLDSDCFEDTGHLILAQDILFQMLEKASGSSRGISEEKNVILTEPKSDSPDISLNTIFYGPPGTGKTYHTVDLAVQIAAPHRYAANNHAANRIVFDELIHQGQVIFTTFHQSLSYEDFIEGLKPSADDNTSVSYAVEDGIFKRIAINAAFEYVGDRSKDASRSLGFSNVYNMLLDEVTEKIERDKDLNLVLKSGSELRIVEITSGGNFLVQHSNGERTYTISRRRLEKLFIELPGLDKVTNISKEIRRIIGGSNSSAYWAVLKKLRSYKEAAGNHQFEINYDYEDKRAAVDKLKPDDILVSENTKAYVLIIDEINRGNVSQIFGELITLIEEDKRYGMREGLSCQLPYSRSRFFIPPNLYLIGTMNTADRSVEALDTALRRRFCFREMMPIYDLTSLDEEYAGITLSELLETINRRIEKLVDRDHQIGHSYFLNIHSPSELLTVFRNKIIPLLQEYFYGNYEKMRLVLGNGFIRKIEEETVRFAVTDSLEMDYLDKDIYQINKNSLDDLNEFELALRHLMNS